MNKIILELADSVVIENGSEEPLNIPDEFCEKFAELIVREILSYTEDGDLDFMKFMIKKNFGVD